jgi:hypothetical protein
MMSHQARSQRIERRPQSSGGIHCVFGYRDSLQQKGERRTHQSVDERIEQGYPTDIGCHVEQHGRVIQQLHSQLNILRTMKQTRK